MLPAADWRAEAMWRRYCCTAFLKQTLPYSVVTPAVFVNGQLTTIVILSYTNITILFECKNSKIRFTRHKLYA